MTSIRDFMQRYSLRRSGWHRFWFAITITLVYAAVVAWMAPSAAQRKAARAEFNEDLRERCSRSCAPKAGALTSEPRNPLYRAPNDVGYRRETVPRCECAE